ncbi:hypothetical protein HD554DRAFT_2304208 [Boletus coccyginus]|nr:hypothetical protein HD554DRAFT_2304208 [Boletus coccyginus]
MTGDTTAVTTTTTTEMAEMTTPSQLPPALSITVIDIDIIGAYVLLEQYDPGVHVLELCSRSLKSAFGPPYNGDKKCGETEKTRHETMKRGAQRTKNAAQINVLNHTVRPGVPHTGVVRFGRKGENTSYIHQELLVIICSISRSQVPGTEVRAEGLYTQRAAEILLGYFWDSENASVMDIDPSDDPTIREALILRQAQDPSSWVSKTLAKPYLWSDPDSDDGSKQSDLEVGSHVKQARSELPTDLSEDGGNERKLRKSDRTGDATDARRELQQEGSSDYNHEPFNRKSDRWQVRVSKLLCTPPVSLDGVSSFLMLPYGPDWRIFAHLDPSRTAKKGD